MFPCIQGVCGGDAAIDLRFFLSNVPVECVYVLCCVLHLCICMMRITYIDDEGWMIRSEHMGYGETDLIAESYLC